MTNEHSEEQPESGDAVAGAGDGSRRLVGSPAGTSSFDAAERHMVDTFVGAAQGTRRSASMLAAAEATALTNLVAVAQRRAERQFRAGASSDMPMRELIAELSAALRVSDRTVQRLLSEAMTLTTAFPRTHGALAGGLISPSHVRVIVEAGSAIGDDEARAGYEEKVLRIAEIESAGRLRSMARVLAARANPEPVDVRHQRARRDRTVRVIDADDGMAFLEVYTAATLVHGIYDRLTQMAKSVLDDEKAAAHAADRGDGVLPGMHDVTEDEATSLTPSVTSPGEVEDRGGVAPLADAQTDAPRGMDELRADLLTDVMLTGVPTGHGDGLQQIQDYVQVTVPVLTAAGVSDEPAVLAGHGPVDSETARCLMATASGWDRVLTHPFSGEMLGVDRYRPSEQLKRFLRVRDQHCRFPSCRMPCWRADDDHTLDAALGGETRDDNLANVCRRHHVVKHKTAWRVRQVGGGKLEWTSPTGRVYVDIPERSLVFVTDGDPPPF